MNIFTLGSLIVLSIISHGQARHHSTKFEYPPGVTQEGNVMKMGRYTVNLDILAKSIDELKPGQYEKIFNFLVDIIPQMQDGHPMKEDFKRSLFVLRRGKFYLKEQKRAKSKH